MRFPDVDHWSRGPAACFICGVMMLSAAALLAQEGNAAKTLSACQKAQAQVLALETENDGLRRAIVALQGQQTAQQVEQGWKSLETELGCTLNRQTLACQPVKQP